MSSPEEGWYPDPHAGQPTGQLRWWDGSAWTENIAQGEITATPAASPTPVEAPPQPNPWQTPGQQTPGQPNPGQPNPNWQSTPQQSPWPQAPAQPGPWPQGPGQPNPWAGGQATPYPQGGFAPADPQRDLENVRKAARTARVAVLIGPLLLVGSMVVTALMVRPVWDTFRDYIDTLEALPAGADPPRMVLPRDVEVLQSVSPLFSIGYLVVLIMLAIWLYRATELARRAQQPVKRSPGWAVAGLFIPIVNLWWPYQSVKSLFPAGTPRPRLGLWWTLHIVTLFVMVPVLVVAFFSTPAGVAAAVVAGLLPLGEALLLRGILTAAVKAQTDLVERR